MKRFRPYFAYLAEAKFTFLAGIAAGLLFAVFSGFGLPFMVEKVFPVIFGARPEIETVISTLSAAEGSEEAKRILDEAFPGEMKSLEETRAVRAWFADKFGAEDGPLAMLVAAALLVPLVTLLKGLAGFFNVYWVTAAGLHVLRRIQGQVFHKIQRLPLGFFSGHKTGDLISRVNGDANILQGVVTTISNDLIKQPFTLIAALCYLVYRSISDSNSFFVLVCLLTIPISIIPIRILGKRLMRRAGNMQKEAGSNTAILAETLGATREVRAFNLEEMLAGRFLEGVRRWTVLHLKVIKYRYLVPPIIEMLAAGALAAALTYGSQRGMTLDGFVPLAIALYMCYEPIKKLGAVHNRLKQGEASLDRLEVILHAEEGVTDPPNPVTIDNVRGGIRFDSVNFTYGKAPALKDISIDIPAGQVVALVGPSGAGKTTFASMIPRFYDPVDGTIELDGVDLTKLRLKDLRDHITIVPQEAVLFSGTVEENIQLGKLDASKGDIERAAKRANAHTFIEDFPDGYATPVGERGAQLSGGQKQRISIARAFLKDAPVLILDEATAALDADTESQIQGELADLTRGRTTLIIAHRFSTIRIADRILVFDKGRIIGDGTFEELEQSNDLFRSLLQNQRH
ncbi:ABC transporter ATP-binding protein [Haloferula rosea]|uniref:ABC transporter ATP-binding protein n=1 Tax=Haloferula rosea TaxID=490093 RepID=A0A934VCT9_9BACT|nr:ABC transporter ATP-binding protein [Haloferula rosea]MBK1828798.1 ABC transporter ATP-binding protein [Haloferula rosea]